MKRVSVIIPIYNVSRYLNQCVESVIRQTYSNLEIILVDDGSTDCSPDLCDKWKEKDKRIKVIHKTNGGLSDARNAGIDKATGEYIYFLDGDDYISEKLIESVVKGFERGADLVAFQYSRVFDSGKKEESSKIPAKSYIISNDIERMHFYVRELLQYGIGWEAWGRAFRKEIIDRYAIRFADNKRIFAEDVYFSLCYCAFVRKIIVLPEILYYYRQRVDSIMGQQARVLNCGRFNELGKEVKLFYQTHKECENLLRHFSVVYYLVLNGAITRYQRLAHLSYQQMRRQLFDDISDFAFFRDQFLSISKEKRLLCLVYDPTYVEDLIAIAQYYALGNRLLFKVRCKITGILSPLISKYNCRTRQEEKEIRSFSRNKKKVYIVGTEDFGNIGDHEIAESIYSFIKKVLGGYSILEVAASEYSKKYELLKKYIKREDILILTGGGNFGSEYPKAQAIRENVCTTWPDNPKIIFPQTIYYSNTDNTMEEIKKAATIFNKKNNVTIFAREKTSFLFAREYFSCASYLVPDIVLSNEMISFDGLNREDIILCLRSDKEKSLSLAEQEVLLQRVDSIGRNIVTTDFQLPYSISKTERIAQIEEKMQMFCTSRLVITDRLHGMIFAAITGTPCVVFNNYNQKITGTYDLISYLPYICYVNSVNEAIDKIPYLLTLDNCVYTNSPLRQYYDKLAEVIREKCLI